MKTLQISFGLLLAVLVISCNDNKKKDTIPRDTHENAKNHTEKEAHWSYEGETGPEHWAEIEANSDCEGLHQSPINILTDAVVKDASVPELIINYPPSTKIHDVINNGHTIQFNFDKGDEITVDNEVYSLIQVHFHEPSEHIINGIRFPLEVHLVHMNSKKQLTVLSVLAQEGSSNGPFEVLEKYFPLASGEMKEVNKTFDFRKKLPENRATYFYQGSLTTPPCTEGVNWFVFKEPITISLAWVKELEKLMPINNYRNEQALNGRVVKTKY